MENQNKSTKIQEAVFGSVDELADFLGIGRQSCYRGLDDGSIPCGIRIGKRWIIPKAAVENWLASAGGKVAVA